MKCSCIICLPSIFLSEPFILFGQISVTPDYKTVELCGTLKNVVAIAAGLVDGLKFVLF